MQSSGYTLKWSKKRGLEVIHPWYGWVLRKHEADFEAKKKELSKLKGNTLEGDHDARGRKDGSLRYNVFSLHVAEGLGWHPCLGHNTEDKILVMIGHQDLLCGPMGVAGS